MKILRRFSSRSLLQKTEKLLAVAFIFKLKLWFFLFLFLSMSMFFIFLKINTKINLRKFEKIVIAAVECIGVVLMKEKPLVENY